MRYCTPLMLAATLPLAAQDETLLDPDRPLIHYDRLDLIGAISPRFPSAVYDPIKQVSAYYYQHLTPHTYLYYSLGAYEQQEGRGYLGSIAGSHDWSDTIFTFAQVSAGTRCDILPRISGSFDLNFKLGCDKSFVVPIGAEYISYWTNQRSLIFSTGFLWYLPEWILGYRFYLYSNTPGALASGGHKVTVIYGHENWQYTTLDVLLGNNSYNTIYNIDPQTINQSSYGAILNHRHWVCPKFGVIVEGGYTRVKDLYRLWRISFGLFKEF